MVTDEQYSALIARIDAVERQLLILAEALAQDDEEGPTKDLDGIPIGAARDERQPL